MGQRLTNQANIARELAHHPCVKLGLLKAENSPSFTGLLGVQLGSSLGVVPFVRGLEWSDLSVSVGWA